MARTPAQVVWSETAFAALQQLSFSERRQILKRIVLIEAFPEMYQVTETGRWRGLRRFFSGGQVVLYGYWPDENNTVYVEVVTSTRHRSE